LEGVYATDLDPIAAQLAAHYEQAGMAAQAIPYYQQAAAVAQRVFAHEEAIRLLHRGLALLMPLPPSQARDERELEMQTALGTSLVTMQHYGAPEVMEVYSRARTLCEQLGRPPSPPILRALVIAHIVHADFQRARDVADQLLALAEQRNDRVLIVEGHYAVGVAVFNDGDFALSRAHLEQSLAQYDAQFAPTHIALFAQDPQVVCLNRLAFDLWCLGYPDQAAVRTREATAAAQALAHPFSTGYHLTFDAVQQCIRQDAQTTRTQAEALIALGREHRLGQSLMMGMAFHGWATAALGVVEPGMTELQQGIADYRASGGKNFAPLYLRAIGRSARHVQPRRPGIEPAIRGTVSRV
jgi:predicted ATPase